MSGSKSDSSSQNRSFVDPAQAPFLQFLREQAQGIAGGQLGQGSQFQSGILDPSIEAFQNFLTPQQNPFLQGQIEQGQGLINRNLTENILPSVGSNAAQFGQRGSSRQGVAEGIAARGAIESSANFAENLTSADFQGQQQRALQALQFAPGIAGLQFSPLQNLSGILGGPTVLGQGSSQSKSGSFGF